MKVYFYHTQNIQYCLRRMAEGEFPSHFLYGACHLPDNGIDVVYHKSPRREMSRLKTAIYTAWRLLTCREHFDAVYATHYKGLELVVMLRALRLFRKPIIVWHHQPIITPKSRLREWGGRLFYRGFDRLIFFSRKLVDDSLKANKVEPRKLVVGHWEPTSTSTTPSTTGLNTRNPNSTSLPLARSNATSALLSRLSTKHNCH